MEDQYGKYPSIKNVWKRDCNTYKVIEGEWACPEFKYLQNCHWHFYEKIDGMNIRAIMNLGKLILKGRTDLAQLPGKMHNELLRLFQKEVHNWESVCFYGEGYGAGIQKGGCYQQVQRFILFDIKIGDRYFLQPEILKVADGWLDSVPLLCAGTLWDGINMVTQGVKSNWPDREFAEGVVGRPFVPLNTQWGERIQVKIKHRDFYRGGK